MHSKRPLFLLVFAIALGLLLSWQNDHARRTGSIPPPTTVDSSDTAKSNQTVANSRPEKSSATKSDQAPAHANQANGRVSSLLGDLRGGATIVIPLSNGESLNGTIRLIQQSPDGTIAASGTLVGNRAGRFSVRQRADRTLTGRVLLSGEKRAYLLQSTASGQLSVQEARVGDVLCDALPREPQRFRSSLREGAKPQASPPLLSSRPSASAVLYLDFDGATVNDPDWSDDPVVAPASTLTNAEIIQVWNLVKEDYWPFNIDVTTDPSRYAATPVGQRMRVIITPNDSVAPGAGGVAYVGSFKGAGTYFNDDIPAWVFNETVDGIAQAIAHELGHTLGLEHDGRNPPLNGFSDDTGDYYYGHGDENSAVSWAPIMGAGYYKKLVQWSKGEYPNATNTQDDVAIISGGSSFTLFPADPAHGLPAVLLTNTQTGYVADEAGNSRGTASAVDFSGSPLNVSGIITSAADSDFYSFTLSSAMTVTINATPANTYAKQANLDIALELQDNNGSVLASANPDTALNASVSQTLATGTYYIKVAGAGRAGSGSDYGYSNYGSIGHYSLTGGLNMAPPVITSRPLTKLVTVGQSASFTIGATGGGTLTYQWKRNGQVIAGATSATYSLATAQLADVGNYEVSVTNGGGSVVSFFQLNVVQPNRAVTGWGDNAYGQSDSPVAGYPVAVATGGSTHSLALLTDGTVISWGTSGYPETIVPAGLSGVVAIASAGNTSMALKGDGTLAVWSNNSNGQNSIPAGLAGVIAVATGGSHCLALKADGTVVAWGDNSWGKTNVPADLSNVVAIDAGGDHSVALKSDGTAVVWGQNINYGSVAVPAGLSGVVAIAAGANHNLVLKADGTIVAWGYNPVGQTTVPAGASPAVAIAAGSSHSVALKADGTVVAWGHNFYNQTTIPAGLNTVYGIGVGNNHVLAVVSPTAPSISGQPSNKTVNAGETITLAVTASGIPSPTYQWRKNGTPLANGGRITGATSRTLTIATAQGADAGNYDVVVTNLVSSATSQAAVVSVTVAPNFSARPSSYVIGPGQSVTLDATASGATSYEWFRNGVPLANTGPVVGIAIASPADAGYYVVKANNSAGTAQTLFYVRVAQSNVVTAWGANDYGQTTVPSGLADVTDLSAGMSHTLALKVDGTVAAWGRNNQGQTTVPVDLSNVVQVSAGAYHSVALKRDGTVVAWGLNDHGQCTVPAGLNNVVFVSAGGAHTVALKNDGTVVAWGDNSDGQATVPNSLRFTYYVSAGLTHTMAITDIGLNGWGKNNFNQATPSGYVAARAVQAAADHTVYLDQSGTLSAWGGIGLWPIVSQATAISVRAVHGLALKNNGLVVAWGPNTSGESSVAPSLGNVQAIAAGEAHNVVLVSKTVPTIFTQPVNYAVAAGGTASFSVSAGAVVSYRWTRNGVDLNDNARFSGTATATLYIANAQVDDAGVYAVRLMNAFGGAESQGASLTVQSILVTNNAGVAANAEGTSVTLSVTVTGQGPFTYQWYQGQAGDTSVPVPNATASSVTVAQGDIGASYWVRVSNGTVSVDSAAFPLGRWKLIDPLFGSAVLSATTYANNRFVAVGTAAGYSANGLDWQIGAIETGADLRSVIHDGTRYIAGGGNGQIYASADGATWQKLRSADSPNDVLLSGAAGNGATVFVGPHGKIMSSTNGTDWSWRTAGLSGSTFRSVTFAAGRFVAVGINSDNYSKPCIFQSTDGVSWTPCTLSFASSNPSYYFYQLSQVQYLGGQFVALGQSGYSNDLAFVLTSSDGVTWNTPVFTNVSVNTNAMVKGDGQLLSGDFRVSSDGIVWSAPQASPPPQLAAVGYGNGTWVALNLGSTDSYATTFASISTSSNLQTWTKRIGYGIPPSELGYGNGRFVALSRTSTGYSSDGLTWTVNPVVGNPISFGAVSFGNGLFVSVVQNGSSGAPSHYISTDGITWTPQRASVLGTYSYFWRIVYAGGQWLASGSSGLYTSSDAITWTLRSFTQNTLNALAYGNGTYVGMGYNGSLVTSLDGVTWTAQLAPTTKTYVRLVFGNGMFVATDDESGLWTSPDGVQWTARPLPTKVIGSYQGYLSDLLFAGGRFCATYGSDVLTSFDGLAWQVTPAALPGPINSRNFSSRLVYGAGSFWAWGQYFGKATMFFRASLGSTVPEIVASPSDVAVASGSSPTLTINASGDSLTYQWYQGLSGDTSSPVANANTASVTLPPVTQTTYYWVKVTGPGGFVNSATVTVSIQVPVMIVTQPGDADIIAGAAANLSVFATGNPTPTYQWYRGTAGDTSRPIAGATAGGYTTPTTVNTVERYWVRATNSAGSVDSVAAVVTPWLERPPLGTLSRLSYLSNRYIAEVPAYPSLRFAVSLNGSDWAMVGNNAPPMEEFAYGAGVYVGFRNASQLGIYTSPDLVTWTSRTVPAGALTMTVAYGSGRFVGGSIGGVVTSTDGATWTRTAFGASESNVTVNSVIYDGNGFLVAGADTATNVGVVLASPDGLTWARRTLPLAPPALKKVVRAGQLLFALADSGNVALASTDSATWWQLPINVGVRLKSAAWIRGTYLLGTDTDKYYLSNDGGQTWAERNGPRDLRTLSLVGENGQVIAAGDGAIYASVDGEHWVRRAGAPRTNPYIQALTFGGGRFVTSGFWGDDYYSVDGIIWSQTKTEIGIQSGGPITFGAGKFICGDGDYAGKLWTSTDGDEWQALTVAGINQVFTAMGYANGLLFALTANGQYATSPDGVNWSVRSLGTSTYLYGVAYGNGKYVLIGSSNVWTSPDLVTWTQSPLTGVHFSAVQFAQGQFVAVGSNSSSGRIMTSPDGNTWTERYAAPSNNSLYGLAYDGQRFAACGSDKVLLSRDGITWREGPVYVNMLTAGNGSFVGAGSNIWQSAPEVLPVPTILSQPASLTGRAGDSVALSVAAAGFNLSYQWKKNGTDIPGATSATYSIASSRRSDTGSYTVVVTNSSGSVTSSVATLTSINPPGDFNGDGKPDLVLQNLATGARSIRLMNGATAGSDVALGTLSSAWSIATTADFNADGQPDLLLQNRQTGERKIRLMNGTTVDTDVSLGTVSTQWSIAAAADFNGDGKSDILWQNTTTGERHLWFMNGSVHTGDSGLGVIPVEWSIAAAADFNGDSKTDILWQNTATGERYLWFMNGSTHTGDVSLGLVPRDWSIAGAADYNGDGKTDILWQNTTTRQCYVWYMNGSAHLGDADLGALPAGWSLAGVPVESSPASVSTHDFNGDGKADILWQNASNGERYLWFMNGSARLGEASLGIVPLAWSIATAADFNGDGKVDILWQNTATGERYLWFMNGSARLGDASLGLVPVAWSIAATADFNGDGKADLLWQNTATGERYLWFMNGSAHTADVSLGIVPLEWSIATADDFNGDGKADILWQNTATGERYLWFMNGSARLGDASLGIIPLDWRIVN